MRSAAALLIVLAAAACDRGKKATPPPKPIAPGPYTVRYDCFHSDQPFGNGSQYRNQSFDLGARTYTRQFYELTGDEPPPDKPEPPPPPPETKPLAAERVAAINAAVEKVLRGGPYKPEYPVPEGTPCTLVILSGDRELYKIEKAAADEPDAVSELVRTLVP
jgi:hypothetical protein